MLLKRLRQNNVSQKYCKLATVWRQQNKSALYNKQLSKVIKKEMPVSYTHLEEHFLLHAEMEEELAEEVSICITTKEVIGKLAMVIEERLYMTVCTYKQNC